MNIHTRKGRCVSAVCCQQGERESARQHSDFHTYLSAMKIIVILFLTEIYVAKGPFYYFLIKDGRLFVSTFPHTEVFILCVLTDHESQTFEERNI